MASKRFLMVLVDSSAARMPRPGATMAAATLFNSVRFIACSSIFDLDLVLEHDLFRKPVSTPDRVRGRLFRDHALSRIHYASSAGRGGSRGCFKHLDAGQHLAFEPFQESAAGGRDIREAAGDAGGIERRH